MIDNNKNFQIINEAFPHIGRKLKLFWGCPEFNTFIDELQTDTRGGTRTGFPGPVLNALFMLATDHDGVFPNLLSEQTDQWISTRRR